MLNIQSKHIMLYYVLRYSWALGRIFPFIFYFFPNSAFSTSSIFYSQFASFGSWESQDLKFEYFGSQQALNFTAGAQSIHLGDRLLIDPTSQNCVENWRKLSSNILRNPLEDNIKSHIKICRVDWSWRNIYCFWIIIHLFVHFLYNLNRTNGSTVFTLRLKLI